MTKPIVVSHLQVRAAKAAIEIAGGPDHVEPIIVKIATAKPRRNGTGRERSA